MKYEFSNPELTVLAQQLRKNMTPQERKLWYDGLIKLPWKFRGQKVIERYIIDFYCAETKIAIEVDGSQHYDEREQSNDEERTAFLNGKGITVLRYSNYDVDNHFDAVCTDIYNIFSKITSKK